MPSERPRAVGLTPLETRRKVVLHVAKRAEELGYDTFCLAEGWGHDAGVLLAEVATQTSRIRIGTGILNVWGRTSASIAMLATSLQEVSGGRFVLGLGAGSPPLAEGFHGARFTAPVQAVGNVTRQVRRLLAGERSEAAVPGSRALRLAVTPAVDVPIYLAALGTNAVRQAGELADGWLPFFLPVSGLDAAVRVLEEGAAKREPDRSLPLVVPSIPTAVSDDPAVALEVASWWVAFYLVSMGPLYRETLTRLGYGEAVADVLAANPTPRTFAVPESARVLLDELTLWGDTEHARAALDRWYAAGAQLPALTLPPGRPVEELDHILESLRPG
jgi:alkanesulfonate monooxygenase SsuD/methylene tetrahydromethanopterin reductase-like flavin-dependent oxidoreductase (luciferase family)